MAQPIGIRYDGPQVRREHQVFPGEYFSGCDVSIYFGDTFIDEITGIEFAMTENTRPVYGYASRTWDTFARGTRIIQGRFRMSFKEAMYLHSVMDHLSENESQPDLIIAPEDAVPVWMQQANERIDRSVNHIPKTIMELKEYDWPELRFGMTDFPNGITDDIKQLKIRLKALGYEMPIAQYGHWPILRFGMQDEFPNRHIAELQNRLARFLIIDIYMSGIFDEATYDAVMQFQNMCNLFPSGQVDGETRKVLEGDPNTMESRSFDSNTFFAVRQFQNDNNLSVTGIVTYATRKALSPTIEVTLPPDKPEEVAIDYEKVLWTQEYQEPFHRKYFPYFYTSRKIDGNQDNLLQNGFNIYIVFGPLQHAPHDNGTVEFKNTVRTLWGVQLGNVSVSVDASGKPIEEIYDFFAQDFE